MIVLSLVTNIVANHPYRSAEAAVDAEVSGIAELANEIKEEVASHQEVRFSCYLFHGMALTSSSSGLGRRNAES